jgi:hypothetical protein
MSGTFEGFSMMRHRLLSIDDRTALRAACTTTLDFRVDRYDLDAGAAGGGAAATARSTYNGLHPRRGTLNEQLEILAQIESHVDNYISGIKGLNVVVQYAVPAGDPAKRARDKTAEIQRIATPLQTAIKEARLRLRARAKDTTDKAPAAPVENLREVSRLWFGLDAQFKKQNIEIKKDNLEKVLGQLAQAGQGTALQDLVAKLSAEKDQLQLDEGTKKFIESTLSQAEVSLAVSQSGASGRIADFLQVGGDLIARHHKVYQDMADPFLVYIAAHPENWRPLDNRATVKGDGDTEFVLVFEQELDGRWKTVSVDPEKVIRARLRVSRKVAGALTALAGMASKAYGVPLPPSLAKDPNLGDTLDYSKLTGEEELMRERNSKFTARLRDFKVYAQTSLGAITEDNAPALHAQLKRRLAEFSETSTAGDKQ